MKLKDGSEVADARLGRLASFDDRSRQYSIAPLAEAVGYRTKYWNVPWVLDQGSTSACVGNSWTGEAFAEPVSVPDLDEDFAQGVYHAAQEIDEWPGHAYDGTSVLAGAKVMQARGYIKSYKWAFSVEEAFKAICWSGPCVLGCGWLQDMFTPTSDYYLNVSGAVAGGHAILVYGLQLDAQGLPHHVLLKNSWGEKWGRYGSVKVRAADFGKLLLQNDGELCVPVGRLMPKS